MGELNKDISCITLVDLIISEINVVLVEWGVDA